MFLCKFSVSSKAGSFFITKEWTKAMIKRKNPYNHHQKKERPLHLAINAGITPSMAIAIMSENEIPMI